MQAVLNALNSPDFGWVMTTCMSVKILPPPTGISDVGMPPAAAALLVDVAGADDVVAALLEVPLEVSLEVGVVFGLAAEPQAARPPAPTTATEPAITERRVA